MALTNLAEEVKARVTMTDILNQYGFHLVMGRMPCPFHNGTDRNLSIKNNRTYRCWVCGEHGDQITFVQRYFGLDFTNALAKINDDFRLGLPIGEKKPVKKTDDDATRKAEERKRIIEERKREATELRTRYEEVLTLFCSCDTIMTHCRPISPSTGVSEAFAWAATHIDALWAELKDIEAQIAEFNRKVADESV